MEWNILEECMGDWLELRIGAFHATTFVSDLHVCVCVCVCVRVRMCTMYALCAKELAGQWKVLKREDCGL